MGRSGQRMGRRACRARGGSPAWLLATLSLLLLPLAATADVLDALGSLRESMAVGSCCLRVKGLRRSFP